MEAGAVGFGVGISTLFTTGGGGAGLELDQKLLVSGLWNKVLHLLFSAKFTRCEKFKKKLIHELLRKL